ncbi:hypothetical protein GGTG_11119 [Gaeumannomyces tritici R3-111a-1]|uniref:Uncharacterized protein n=1 Tax=Gaeumannomyces tritici (strain R3-111a-1) TaxID=644352 RepID=J3PC96_GAET3|nr:hypothetical protein GGTG_11119 [Gaeumannomyces tritici R3-111a-1]EJT71866.1 hypothetical protein GGTG_11119 [Gaeumannomyces tritici R3-111a-1]
MGDLRDVAPDMRVLSVPGLSVLAETTTSEGREPDSGSPMSTRDIIDRMAEILLAGSETTSDTITCLLLELARNLDVCAELLASMEPQAIHGDSRAAAPVRVLRGLHQGEPAPAPYRIRDGPRHGNQWDTLMGYNLAPHTVVLALCRDLHRNG